MNLCNPNTVLFIFEDDISILEVSIEKELISHLDVYSLNGRNSREAEELFEYQFETIHPEDDYEFYVNSQVEKIFALYCHYMSDDYPNDEIMGEISQDLDEDYIKLFYYNEVSNHILYSSGQLDDFNKSFIRDNNINKVLKKED